MKIIYNTIIPKQKLFMCIKKQTNLCPEPVYINCYIGVGSTHTHSNNEDCKFHCKNFEENIECAEVNK